VLCRIPFRPIDRHAEAGLADVRNVISLSSALISAASRSGSDGRHNCAGTATIACAPIAVNVRASSSSQMRCATATMHVPSFSRLVTIRHSAGSVSS